MKTELTPEQILINHNILGKLNQYGLTPVVKSAMEDYANLVNGPTPNNSGEIMSLKDRMSDHLVSGPAREFERSSQVITVKSAICIAEQYAQQLKQQLEQSEQRVKELEQGIADLINLNERSSARYKACFEKENPNGHQVFDLFISQLKALNK